MSLGNWGTCQPVDRPVGQARERGWVVPIRWDELDVGDTTDEAFNALPARGAGRRIDPRQAAILDDVAAGKVRTIRVPDERDLRGIRVSLGRLATQRGFKLDYRVDGSTLYVRRSDEPVRGHLPGRTQSEGASKRRGRPRMAIQETESDADGRSETNK